MPFLTFPSSPVSLSLLILFISRIYNQSLWSTFSHFFFLLALRWYLTFVVFIQNDQITIFWNFPLPLFLSYTHTHTPPTHLHTHTHTHPTPHPHTLTPHTPHTPHTHTHIISCFIPSLVSLVAMYFYSSLLHAFLCFFFHPFIAHNLLFT